MQQQGVWKKPVKLIILLALLAIGTAIYVSCGEETLPPLPPPGTGIVIVTGGAV